MRGGGYAVIESAGSLFWGGLFILIGILFLGAAVFRWTWFAGLVKVRLTYRALGESGATVFYAAVGVGGLVMGILTLIGVV